MITHWNRYAPDEEERGIPTSFATPGEGAVYCGASARATVPAALTAGPPPRRSDSAGVYPSNQGSAGGRDSTRVVVARAASSAGASDAGGSAS